jgi:hypothetical protein
MDQHRVLRGSVQGAEWLSSRVQRGSVEDAAWLSKGAAWLGKGAAWLSKGAAWLSKVRHSSAVCSLAQLRV